MSGSERAFRIGEQVKRALARIINSELRDENLRMLCVTAVKVSADLSVARVYISSLLDEERHAAILEILTESSGFLRRRLSGTLNLRHTPTLKFVYDESIEYGRNMESLISDIISEDSKNKP